MLARTTWSTKAPASSTLRVLASLPSASAAGRGGGAGSGRCKEPVRRQRLKDGEGQDGAQQRRQSRRQQQQQQQQQRSSVFDDAAAAATSTSAGGLLSTQEALQRIAALDANTTAAAVEAAAAATATRRQRNSIMTPALPQILAFDLDATLWWPELYMLDGGAPFKKDNQGRVFDRSGEQMQLMGDTVAILREIATDPKWRDTEVAYVSRTEYPKWADTCLQLFEIAPGRTMHCIAEHFEIYPGTKTRHFKQIAGRSGIEYTDMLFFDNETWNCRDCEPLGVVCQHTPDGMTLDVWQKGLAKYAASKLQGARKK